MAEQTSLPLVLIDISAGCGPVDYQKVAAQVDGVIFRVTEGTAPDMYALDHWRGFRAAGVPFGVYGWHNPSPDAAQNRRQAESLCAIVDYFGEIPKLGVWGDWETDNKDLTFNQMGEAIWKYISRVEELLKIVTLGAYTSANFWDNQVANITNGNTDIPRGRPLWVANWFAASPRIPYDWAKRGLTWKLWQYSNHGRIEGINASVDLNKFNGSREDFYHLHLDDKPPVEPPPVTPPPATSPAKVKIAHLLTGETLNLRVSIGGTICGHTWNDCQFDVMTSANDATGRAWYLIGPKIYIASWYTEPV